MSKHETIKRVDIELERNEDNELRWIVTPYILHHGRLVCVPDSKGWVERVDAEAERNRILERLNK